MPAGLPLPYKHESLLAEVLFSQLLRVPAPAHKALSYAALMVDLCKLMPTFPRSMSTCVRECFSRRAPPGFVKGCTHRNATIQHHHHHYHHAFGGKTTTSPHVILI